MVNQFYVYGLFDPFTQILFYIGKGKGRRAFDHIGKARRGSHLLVHKKIRSLSLKPIIKILTKGLTESDAYELEELAIATVGRRCDKSGPLLNLSIGGEGGTSGHIVVLTPEQAEKRNKALRSPEVRKKISEGVKNSDRNLTESGRAKLSAANKGKILSEETKLKISKSKTGKPGHPMTAANKARLAKANRGRVVSDATKQKISESVKKRPITAEQQKRQREKTLIQVECPNCGKVGARSIMMRWHFDNCRQGADQ